MAPSQLAERRYDAVLLVASIEQARLEGRAPEIPHDLRDDYAAAIAAGLAAAQSALPRAWNNDAELALWQHRRVLWRSCIDYLEGGDPLDAFLADFPDVSREHAVAVLELAKQALDAHATTTAAA